jgi:DNA-binding response OmpR family regulator
MKKILVIEDESEMRRNLTTILRLEKFHPLPAETGRVGLELAKKERPDLILCDVMMPELDGYGVIAALRADAETVTIPFIFLTAKGEKPDIRAGMNLGADDYLTKPVAKADLLTPSTRVFNARSSKRYRSSNLTSIPPDRWRKCSA